MVLTAGAAIMAIPLVRMLRSIVDPTDPPLGPRVARATEWGVPLAALAVPISATPLGLAAGEFWLACAVGWVLVVLAWIDIRHLLLPDLLTLPLLLLGLSVAWVAGPVQLTDRAAGAILGYAGLMAVALTYRWIRGQDGLGAGDAKLLAAGGAWVGAQALPTVLLGGALLGLAWSLTRLGRGDRIGGRTMLPFGPCLAAAIWATWLWRLAHS